MQPKEANLAAGFMVGGFYGLLMGKTQRSAAAGMLVGASTVVLGTLAVEGFGAWRIRKALVIQEQKERAAQGIPEPVSRPWTPNLPKWFPLQITDLSKPHEKTEAEKMDIEIFKLEKEIKEREARLREEELLRARELASQKSPK